jgi:hypothetical protein
MTKFTKLAMVAGALTFVASGAFAGLSLCSDKNVPKVAVACGANAGSAKDTGYPINPGACAAGGNMPWSIIKQKLDSDGKGVCLFSVNGVQVGQASVQASLFSGTISSATINKPYTIAPATFPQSGQDIKIQISMPS